MAPGETVFLDSSTTSYFVARRIIETGIATTVLTNSFPVMELIFNESGPNAEIIGVGGSLRRLTRSFVGPFAVRTVQGHFADRLFLSVKGLTETGMMTDADALEAEVKRTMIAQAGESTLLVDQLEDAGARPQRRSPRSPRCRTSSRTACRRERGRGAPGRARAPCGCSTSSRG